MPSFVIEGGYPIEGRISPQGNKNEALPVLCASLMVPGKTQVKNLPLIEDVFTLGKLLKGLGVEVSWERKKKEVSLYASSIEKVELSPEESASIRGSVTLMAPLLVRKKEVFLPRPGGDRIGRRRIDTHLQVAKAFGAEVEIYPHGYYFSLKDSLQPADILLEEASVTATENAIMLASVAPGISRIENAACEPHVQGLCRFFEKQGVKIQGIGSNILEIHGVGSWENLKGDIEHTLGEDYIEVGSFVAMAALTGGELEITPVTPRILRRIQMGFSRLGIQTLIREKEEGKYSLYVPPNQERVIQEDAHGAIPKIDDGVWPHFPADLISIMIVSATQSKGVILIHEKLFESRLFFVDKLISMGAKILLCDPHRAMVIGPTPLYGTTMSSPDIRAGMALLIAALCAKGESIIHNITQIDRGYEKIEERIQPLGAKIQRIP